MMIPTRREFLRFSAGLGLSAGAAAFMEKLALSTAWAQGGGGYKALVCIFLNGGNDANNTVVPLSGAPGFPAADVTGGYTAYSAERSPGGLALPAPPASGAEAVNQLKRISPGAANPGLGGTQETFGLHPNLDTLPGSGVTSTFRQLYNQGRVAIVCNVGTLLRPTSKAQYQSNPGGAHRPDQLFSHSDQIRENQTCYFTAATAVGNTGWGGRITDRTRPLFDPARPNLSQTSISGSPQFMTGVNNFPIVIGPAPTALNQVLVLQGFGTAADEVTRRNAFHNLRMVNLGTNKLVDGHNAVMDGTVAVMNALTVDPVLRTGPAPGTTFAFPNTGLGNQLAQVAKVIKANLTQSALNLQRQIFFVSIGGFDTHQNQGLYNAGQGNLLNQVGQGMAAFYHWMVNETNLGNISSQVTLFTLSDFSRTFNPAGSGAIVGSDHAWGSHFLVAGGAVNGGRFYGVPLPGGNGTVFPTLGRGTSNAYDTDNGNPAPGSSGGARGRWIPSVSTLQYANTLAAWFGLPQDSATLDLVFPLLRANFAQTNLGFV